MNEAERKRTAALAAAGPFVTNELADVRWLLCGRGRPVAVGTSPYTVEVADGVARVWYQDIEHSRVESEERWDELGYEAAPYPWYESPPEPTAPRLQHLRLALGREEADRYRRAGADAAVALVDVLGSLTPKQRELDAAGALAARLHADGFTTPVVLVGGEERAPVHRHPLPTHARLGRFALLAASVERDGLYVSLTRVVSFGEPPPPALAAAVATAADVDAAVLAAARPGTTLGALFAVLERAYADAGVPDEWRRHHQGGLTGYNGREVFAVPGDETVLPDTCAVAFNPSVTGGGKSEDTALVTRDGVEILTSTPQLPTLPNGRPAIVSLAI